MKTVTTPKAMQALAATWKRKGLSVGFVPTMGALHRGHRALVERARRENDRVVVSVFVNPLQFGPKEDFHKYPRPFAKDAALCRKAGVDALYHPSVEAMYPKGSTTRVEIPAADQGIEGRFRPGHFSGVATVVLKLFSAALPDRAYFGEKDWQQLQVVKQMARDLDLSARIVGVPTVREKDGMALSSRNAYLSPQQRADAVLLSRGLKAARGTGGPAKARARALALIRKIPGVRIDYVEVVQRRILAAIRVGKTRLIDNYEL